jgi:hypothetical protein
VTLLYFKTERREKRHNTHKPEKRKNRQAQNKNKHMTNTKKISRTVIMRSHEDIEEQNIIKTQTLDLHRENGETVRIAMVISVHTWAGETKGEIEWEPIEESKEVWEALEEEERDKVEAYILANN